MCLELRLASSVNNRLPIECNSPPPTLPHDSRAVVCSMNFSGFRKPSRQIWSCRRGGFCRPTQWKTENWNDRSSACQAEQNSYIVCKDSLKKRGAQGTPFLICKLFTNFRLKIYFQSQQRFSITYAWIQMLKDYACASA